MHSSASWARSFNGAIHYARPLPDNWGIVFSKRGLVVVSLCLWSGVTLLTGLARSAIQLMTCQSLLALTQPLFAPVAMALMANAHGTKTRSRAISVYATAQLAGVVMGGMVRRFCGSRVPLEAGFLFAWCGGNTLRHPVLGFSEEPERRGSN
jgi:sugar phosphate permease